VKIEEICEDEEFELISHAGTGEAPEAQEEEEKPTEDQVKDREEKLQDQSIFVTRSGEAFHTYRKCGHLKNYMVYERTPCQRCHYRSKHIIKRESVHRSEFERWLEGDVLTLTTKDQYYHHPECKVARQSKSKDRRTKCLDCIKWFEAKEEPKDEGNGLSQHRDDERRGEGKSSSSHQRIEYKDGKDEF